MPKSYIFDLDGTLIDSEKLIRRTFIQITKKLAPNRIQIANKIIIGPPLRETISNILGNSKKELLEKFQKDFMRKHDGNLLTQCESFPNSTKILNELFISGNHLALATNKRKIPTLKLINHYGWGRFFKQIECSDSESKFRSKSQLLQEIIKKNGEFKSAFFIGDTTNDGNAAKVNNLEFIETQCSGLI